MNNKKKFHFQEWVENILLPIGYSALLICSIIFGTIVLLAVAAAVWFLMVYVFGVVPATIIVAVIFIVYMTVKEGIDNFYY